MGDRSTAFVRGGCGCLLGTIVLGLFVALMGGRFRMDAGGALLLFLIGGVVGLIFLAGYNRGRRAGPSPPPPIQATWWCRACGCSNALEAKICQRCHAGR